MMTMVSFMEGEVLFVSKSQAYEPKFKPNIMR